MTDQLAPVPPLAEDEAGLPGPAIGEPPVALDRHKPFRSLRHREFRLLFTAYAIGDLGFWISHISLQSEMARVSDNSSIWLGILFFGTFIPMLLFAPFAGVVADRVDRKKLLMASRAAVGVVAACLSIAVLSGFGTPGVLTFFGFCIGTLFAFMAPAQQAATANAVPIDDLSSAISVESAGSNISRIAGPALAAPILVAWGAGWSFAVYAASNVLMLLALAPVHLKSQIDRHEPGNGWERWKEGLRHARDRPPAVAALVTMGVFSVFGAAHVVLLPIFATDVLHRPRDDFTVLVIASGVGAVIGALTTGFRRSVPTLGNAATWVLAFGIAAGGFALSTSWPLSLGLIAVVGFCYFSTTTSLNTLLQHLADDEKRGRLMGLFAVAWAGLLPLGAIWMGAVASATSAPVAVGIGAVVCSLYAGVLLIRRVGTSSRDQARADPSQSETEPPR